MKDGQKGRVLIVEDDMLLSMVEERLIKRLGFEVIGKVTKGTDAIEKEEELSPDIIVMDISLKGDMDGIEAMEAIRENSDVPVIYLSGSGDRYSLERAKKTGFTDFLTKPVTGGDLKEPLYAAMNSHKEQSENNSQVLKSA
ncbi:MAG: response regulator [Aliifodinibius sp.]|nr:response regulator [Fodinibius sp.]NIV13705.1 response regulator [Fodinibius sp.]NIY27464.1 response regulator [Fodinibius sp.]